MWLWGWQVQLNAVFRKCCSVAVSGRKDGEECVVVEVMSEIGIDVSEGVVCREMTLGVSVGMMAVNSSGVEYPSVDSPVVVSTGATRP